ncbi:putative transcriptional regulator [Lactococcus phage vB_Llc_bIBBA3]|uniref:Transcriptional regulator n=1 Tax=Lactococcus phage vB_Llc_bIBBA3 TaxID=2305484 RepID=A0A678VG60_9CAUD|nr:transcriptional regulator [Lactococcus phage vB_Llc_bIBBA3]AXY83660.1 putative transcriptional regulator [Lactococcus phage vB_Llc_bIBBA3]
MVYVVYIVSFILYSWFLIKVGKKNAENKDTIKLVITGKPEQIKKALESINEQNLIK